MPLVVLNPVAARLCRHPCEWRWSSYHAIVAGRASATLAGLFGRSTADAVRGYREAVDAAVQVLIEQRATNAGELWSVARSIIARLEGSA